MKQLRLTLYQKLLQDIWGRLDLQSAIQQNACLLPHVVSRDVSSPDSTFAQTESA